LESKNCGVIFKPSAYHLKIFKVSSTNLYIRGKIKYSNGWIQIIQPQIIKSLNKIVPKYTPLRNDSVFGFNKKHISLDSLAQEGLDVKKANIILDLHYPTIEFYNHFIKEGYSKETLYTLKFVEIFDYLKRLSKKSIKFNAKSQLDGSIEDFIKNLPFKLTNDQLKVIEEIRADLKSKYASKRVIMGDVGSGKTMVILASVATTYPNAHY